jgi:hypothetical protein
MCYLRKLEKTPPFLATHFIASVDIPLARLVHRAPTHAAAAWLYPQGAALRGHEDGLLGTAFSDNQTSNNFISQQKLSFNSFRSPSLLSCSLVT